MTMMMMMAIMMMVAMLRMLPSLELKLNSNNSNNNSNSGLQFKVLQAHQVSNNSVMHYESRVCRSSRTNGAADVSLVLTREQNALSPSPTRSSASHVQRFELQHRRRETIAISITGSKRRPRIVASCHITAIGHALEAGCGGARPARCFDALESSSHASLALIWLSHNDPRSFATFDRRAVTARVSHSHTNAVLVGHRNQASPER